MTTLQSTPKHCIFRCLSVIDPGSRSDVPSGAGIAEAAAADDAGAVDLPHRGLSAAVLEQDVGAAVVVVIAGVDNVPTRPGIGSQGASADHAGPVQFPDRDCPAVVLPQDVGKAVVVEIAAGVGVPGRARIADTAA